MPRDREAIVKIALDFLILLAVGFPILIFYLAGQPYLRGYHCDDDSIRYPFQESTISNNVLYVVGIFLPTTVIIITEFVNESRKKRESRGRVITLLGRPIPTVVWRIYSKLGVFLFGACLSQLTTDIGKYSIGRLRPHFLRVCNSSFDCNAPYVDPHMYVDTFVCLGKDQHKIREARLSFPSGHSSFSAYSMVYTVIYLQANMLCKTNTLLKPFIQFILLMMTWYTALSRISDYKHHWSDVMIGWLLGIIVALLVSFFVSDFFKRGKEKPDEISLQAVTDGPSKNYNTMETGTNVDTT